MPSLLRTLEALDVAARQQGSSLAQILAHAGRSGPGVDVFLRRPVADVTIDPSEADSLEELQNVMGQLTEAIAALTLEAEEQKGQLASVVVYVQGVPGLIAAAVAQALTEGGIDETAAAAAVNAARQAVSDSTDAALAAIAANRPAGEPGPDVTVVNPTPPEGTVEPRDTPADPTTAAGAGPDVTTAPDTPPVTPPTE
ncbi:MAG: hypothetical protein IPK79_01415 [Vampirovibrionales bacterium]|nr:hypothetical protein [Vampirovibrionales bacterium]